MTQYRDYRPEVRDLVLHLVKAGFSIVAVDDGGDRYTSELNTERIAEIVTSVDESSIFVSHPTLYRRDGVTLRVLSLFIVLGNSPGELVCDYTDCRLLEAAIDDCSSEWEGREQPMKEEATIGGAA